MGFLPVFGRNGEIYDGYYTPKTGQLIAFVQVFTFSGSTHYNSHSIPDGSSNHHRAHKQLWFDDKPNENVVFLQVTEMEMALQCAAKTMMFGQIMTITVVIMTFSVQSMTMILW
nr:hypothetical protein [uncultured Marinobacter sp.]